MTTVEFRDGERDVPDHVEVMLRGLATHTMTYEEAIRISEKRMVTDRLNQEQARLMTEHFRGMRS
jgi:hypothetical protein